MQRLPAIIFAIALSAISADTARADGALAVGVPDGILSKGLVYGASWNVTSVEAEIKAMKLCKGIDLTTGKGPDNPSEPQAACKIVKTFRGQCVALTFNSAQNTPSTGMGWAVAPSMSEARQHAVFDCNAMRGGRGPGCRVDLQACDKSN